MDVARPSLKAHEKAEGAMLALAAGDALGWPQEFPANLRRGTAHPEAHIEFRSWVRRSGGRYRPFEEHIEPGSYSDDTQLTLAVARARTEYSEAWWRAFTRIELPFWTVYQRGGGGATLRAANAWARGHSPWTAKRLDQRKNYFDAGGNGVAMRVLPHAIYYSECDDVDSLLNDVVRDGSATHGNPRALIGATVYAYSAWSLIRQSATLRFGELLDLLLDTVSSWSSPPGNENHEGTWFETAEESFGTSFHEIWDMTTHEMIELLTQARQGIRAGVLSNDREVLEALGCFSPQKGAGTISAAAAVYLFARYAAEPKQGIVMAAFEKGTDTDTIAAMVGGLVGSLSGIQRLPNCWLGVQDADYIRTIAAHLINGPSGSRHQPVRELTNPRQIFIQLESIKERTELDLADRTVEVTRIKDPKPIAKSLSVRSWFLRTSFGQTMYVNRTKRVEDRSLFPESPPVSPRIVHANPNVVSRSRMIEQPRSDELYSVFRRSLIEQLKHRGSLKPSEIQSALDLVQSQVTKWVERAIEENWLVQASQKPKRYQLKDDSIFDSHK